MYKRQEYHSPCLAELREVSVSYGGKTICEPVSFVLKQGERIALQGVNGCGKSSLLRLLMGQAVPHSGTAVSYTHLDVYKRQAKRNAFRRP